MGEGFVKGFPACFTAKAPGIDGKTDPFSMDGKVSDPVLPTSETDQDIGTAMRATCRRRDGFSLDLVVSIGFIDLKDTVGGEI